MKRRTCVNMVCVLAASGFIYGCSSGKFQTHAKKPDPIKVKEALDFHEKELQERKTFTARRHIQIDGTDIQLPLTPSGNKPSDKRFYSFWVWAHHEALSQRKTMSEMLNNEFRVDVIGVKAAVFPVKYDGTNVPSGLPGAESRDAVEVRVESEDIVQSFEIMAWFPKDYQEWEFSHQLQLRKLQSQAAQLKSESQQAAKDKKPFSNTNIANKLEEQIEVELMRENPFACKKAIRVYNGDLRTRIYMASEDEVAHNFGPEFAKYFHVGRVYLRNRQDDKQLVVYTTSLRAHTLLYRAPNLKVAKALEDRKRKDTKSVLDRLDNLDRRIAMNLQGDALSASRKALTLGDAMELMTITRNLPVTTSPEEVIKQAGIKSDNTKPGQKAEAIAVVTRFQKAYKDAIDSLLLTPELYFPNWTNLTKRAQSTELNRLTSEFQNPFASASKSENIALNRFAEQVYRRLEPVMSEIEKEYALGTPLDFRVPITVLPSRQWAAFSEDARTQAKFGAQGFIWHDYYRPMTFQSVLNSLIATSESGWRSQLVHYLQSAGMVAGGMAGLGAIFNEVTSRSYAEAVAFSTAVFIPELQKRLLDDLNKYIRNLGDLGMDSVVVVPPNGSVDKYVFFPRGPIWYGVDEFSIDKPSFIVQVDGTDVSIEATLIDRGKEVTTGQRSAEALVGEALNEGKSRSNAEETQMIQMNENLRTLRLTALPGDIDTLVAQNNTKGAVHLIQSFQAAFGEDKSGVIDRLVAKYQLPVLKRNQAPTISPISDIGLEEDATATVYFQINDSETPRAGLKVWAVSSSNETLLTTNRIVIQGTNENYSAKINPLPDANGDTRVTIAVSGGEAVTRSSFNVHVEPANDRPVLLLSANTIELEAAQTSAGFKLGAWDVDNEDMTLTIQGNTNALKSVQFKGQSTSLPFTSKPFSNLTNELVSLTLVTNQGGSELVIELKDKSETVRTNLTLKVNH